MTMSESRSTKSYYDKTKTRKLEEDHCVRGNMWGVWKDEQRPKVQKSKSIVDQEKNKNKHTRTKEYTEDTFSVIAYIRKKENPKTLYKL